MTSLNQIIAVEVGTKAHTEDAKTTAYHLMQKAELFSGISRTYQAKEDDGDALPPESTRVQQTAADLLAGVAKDWGRLLDITATKDWTNTRATADVVVDGVTIIAGAPTTFLVWFEKQLVDLRTMISKLPILDPAFDWSHSEAAGAWATPVIQTTRSRKIPRAFVKYEATPDHPAQVEVFTEDEIAGTWDTIKFSGAMPQDRVDTLLDRVDALQSAVKMAREEANGIEVTDVKVGGSLFDFLLAS